jgi:ADP-dependent NAD(P)H-hydrate dehydratase / NAD(P)H-hydrate epimerase
MSPPRLLYSVAQVRALDDHAIRVAGIPGYTLMKRAGEAALRALRVRWPTAVEVTVVTGSGSNAGDGFVLARFGRAAGLSMRVLALTPIAALKGDARRAADDYLASGGRIESFSAAALADAEVIVDALLGTGARGPLREEWFEAINAINASGRPAFALDLPSGLDGDTGEVFGAAVRAECTITFVGVKTGLHLGHGPEHAGRVLFDDLGVSVPAGAEFRPLLESLTDVDISRALPRRARSANKGDFGRVLIIGSGVGMPGAVRLAGEACLRVGAGLVTTATAPENVAPIASGRPELICLGVESAAQLAAAMAKADVIAIGPGLGQGPWAQELLEAALASGKRLVIDADALNLLAAKRTRPASEVILTPHPGEAGRLLGISSTAVQADRLAALNQLVATYGGVVVLKGAGTLLGTHDRIGALCERGNPGMAAPGMGDVLTGAIAGVLAQSGDPWLAARAAVQAHALAGDELARSGGERGMLSLELARGLTHWVNGGT